LITHRLADLVWMDQILMLEGVLQKKT